MNIVPLKVTVREVVTGYVDDSDREEGICGYGGRTDIALNVDGKPKCPYSRIIIRRKR